MRLMHRNLIVLGVIIFSAGCMKMSGNTGDLQSYPLQAIETDWIRNGEPIKFEGELWSPADGTETFLDSEMTLMGEYRGVQFFTDKRDVRPYNRLYTKFAKNQYRYFQKKDKL